MSMHKRIFFTHVYTYTIFLLLFYLYLNFYIIYQGWSQGDLQAACYFWVDFVCVALKTKSKNNADFKKYKHIIVMCRVKDKCFFLYKIKKTCFNFVNH